MSNLTRYLLWAYVFAVSWDTIALPLVGSASRAIGLVVVGTAVLTKVVEGRLRKPDGVFCLAMGFVVWNALSLLWTLSYGATMGTVFLYAQLIGSLWVIRESVTDQGTSANTAHGVLSGPVRASLRSSEELQKWR